MKKLSIIIPTYNEEVSILKILNRINPNPVIDIYIIIVQSVSFR